MKKEKMVKRKKVFGDYEKRRLLECAASFENLADTFLNIPGQLDKGSDRTSFVLERRLKENRLLLAEHLFEMADVVTEVAQESVGVVRVEDKVRNKVEKALHSKGIEVISMNMLYNRNKHFKLLVNMKAIGESNATTEEIGEILSTHFDRKFVPVKGSVSMLHQKEECIMFEEDSKYHCLMGVARAVKENEVISGDHFAFKHVEEGNVYMLLADGAGSGEKASQSSKTVIELMEKFIEAGFSMETAVQMVNGVLLASDEEQNLSTLDICHVDLHTGDCEFMKIGAANSYVKNGDLVEVVISNTLPLGVFYRVEMQHTKTNVGNSDYIIMMSDGILESINLCEGKEEAETLDAIGKFESMLSQMRYESPQEIANLILSYAIHQAEGEIKDDMTVLVLGIWENSLHF